jgi:uncharacterized protein (DUF2384 family)
MQFSYMLVAAAISRTRAMRAVSRAPADEGAVLGAAVLRAAEHLGIPNKRLAAIVGISESSLSRMARGGFAPRRGDKDFELCALFLRLFRSLDAFVGGDQESARVWLRSPNIGLAALPPDDYLLPREELARRGKVPLDELTTIPGLLHVIDYLDSRRGSV